MISPISAVACYNTYKSKSLRFPRLLRFDLANNLTDRLQLSQLACSAYSEEITARSARIFEVATSYLRTLDTSTPDLASSPAKPDTIASTIESLTLAAGRETAFVTAIMAASSPILHLSHNSPYSSMISPILSCNLHSATYPSKQSRSIILHCVDQILETAKTARAENGDLIAFLQHCACWGPGFLICGWGILISYEASIVEGCEGDLDTAKAEEGLDLCEAILASQKKWSAQALFAAELGLMRQTSLLSRGEAPKFDDGWSEEVFAPCV